MKKQNKIVSELKITSPLFVMLPRVRTEDRKVFLNMNSYGNTNTFTNNEAKAKYKEEISEQLEGLTLKTPVEITYQVFKPSRRRLDKMNVIAVVSKYLLDAISELGCWEDDNDDIIKTETILPTEYRKDNGVVEIFIKSIVNE